MPLAAAPGGVRIAVRLTPRGRGDRIDGVARLADGTPVVKASVGAPPEDGRANEALLRLLAAQWGLARCDLTDLNVQETPIEEVIRQLFHEQRVQG